MNKAHLLPNGKPVTNGIKAILKNRFKSLKEMTSSFMPHNVNTKRLTNYQLYPQYLDSAPRATKHNPAQMFDLPRSDHSKKTFDDEGCKFVRAERLQGVHQITLCRKEALNALNHAMIRELAGQVEVARNSASVTHLFIRSQLAPAVFCAGGDVKLLAQMRDAYLQQVRFMRDEFRLNYQLATFSKETVSFPSGLVMGGGAGLSLHCKWRVATENTQFSMPESKIGWFADVGTTFLLSRLPYSLGVWMGLTGNPLKAWDLYHLGIVTHVVPEERMDNLYAELVNAVANGFNIQSVLQHHSCVYSNEYFTHETLERFCMIQKVFSKPTLNEILEGLKEMASKKDSPLLKQQEWASQTLDQLLQYSPISLAVTFELLSRAKGSSFMQCIMNEFSAACGMLRQSDFYAGVEAKLIKKSAQKPDWNPSDPRSITGKAVYSIFAESGKVPEDERLTLSPTGNFLEYPHGNCNLPSIDGIKGAVKSISAAQMPTTMNELIERVKESFPHQQQQMFGFDNFISTVTQFHCQRHANRWAFVEDIFYSKSKI